MLRRYRKLKEDIPLSAAKIEDDTLQVGVLHQDKCLLSSSISIYLHLSPSIFFYLLLPPSISFYRASKISDCETDEGFSPN